MSTNEPGVTVPGSIIPQKPSLSGPLQPLISPGQKIVVKVGKPADIEHDYSPTVKATGQAAAQNAGLIRSATAAMLRNVAGH